MKLFQLRSVQSDTLLFEGHFTSYKACLEQAISERVHLHNLDLRHKNISNTNLDEGVLPGADFSHANLSGANLSDTYLKGAKFAGSALYNTCLCDANLSGCDFTDAGFGATDIHGAILSRAQFSTLSCFSLDFTGARQMDGCFFINPDGRICAMSRPPVVIRGLGREPIILMDRHIKSGHNIINDARLHRLARKLSTTALYRHLDKVG